MKVIIAGSRDFDNYKMLNAYCSLILKGCKKADIEIISGGAKGADSLAEKFALEHNLIFKKFPANWETEGKQAGTKRNREMINYVRDSKALLIAFWDGTSPGTKNMITISINAGISVSVINYNNLSA